MKTLINLRMALIWGCLYATTIPVEAAPLVYGAPATMGGTRAVGIGLHTSGDPQHADASLTFNVQSQLGGWLYSYTFRGIDSPLLSHVTLDLGDTCTGWSPTSSPCLSNIESKQEGGDWTAFSAPVQFGDFDGITGAVRFGEAATGSVYGIRFFSAQAPVWGDIYMGAGSSDYIRNDGFGLHGTSTVYLNFVARPDAIAGFDPPSEVPEPSSMALIGSAVLALGAFRFRRG